MRELNECRAEIFRRSEKRIRDRKRRRALVTAVCIPLCLMLTVLPFVLPPSMSPNSEDGAAEGTDEMTEINVQESFVCTYIRADIHYEGVLPEDKTFTDRAEVTRLFCAVHMLFPGESGGDTVVDKEETAEDAAADNGILTESSAKHSDFVITFTDAEDNQTVYILRGNRLVNEDTDETVILTDDGLTELKKTVGLPE